MILKVQAIKYRRCKAKTRTTITTLTSVRNLITSTSSFELTSNNAFKINETISTLSIQIPSTSYDIMNDQDDSKTTLALNNIETAVSSKIKFFYIGSLYFLIIFTYISFNKFKFNIIN